MRAPGHERISITRTGFASSSTAICVVAQRLVRTLCPHCKAEDALANLWRSLVAPWRLDPPPRVFGPRGCLGLYEILTLNDDLKLITPHLDEAAMRAKAYREGMRLSGARMIAKGVTGMTEVLKVVPLAAE